MSAPENPPVPTEAQLEKARLATSLVLQHSDAAWYKVADLIAESEQARRAELAKAKADLQKNIRDYLNQPECCDGESCGCRGITRIQQLAYETAGPDYQEMRDEVYQLRESKRVMQLALQSAEAIFSELDSCSWPQSERDQFYGEPGQCPVNYDGAKADVSNALALTPETIAALAHPDSAFLEFIRTKCKVLYWPRGNGYPIEHSLAARKDQWDAIDKARAGGAA